MFSTPKWYYIGQPNKFELSETYKFPIQNIEVNKRQHIHNMKLWSNHRLSIEWHGNHRENHRSDMKKVES